jgi:hypothetical protein
VLGSGTRGTTTRSQRSTRPSRGSFGTVRERRDGQTSTLDRARGGLGSRTRHRLGLVGAFPALRGGVSDSASSATRLGPVVCGFNRLAWPRGRRVYLVYLDSAQRPYGTGVGKVLVLFLRTPLSYFSWVLPRPLYPRYLCTGFRHTRYIVTNKVCVFSMVASCLWCIWLCLRPDQSGMRPLVPVIAAHEAAGSGCVPADWVEGVADRNGGVCLPSGGGW